jgi:hypothetical protein
MIVISKKVVADIIAADGWREDAKVYAIFAFESPTGSRVWDVCFSWTEADECAVKKGAEKVWEREGKPETKGEIEEYKAPPDDPDEAPAAIKRAADQEWARAAESGIFERKGTNREVYGWWYLRPQVQAWAACC